MVQTTGENGKFVFEGVPEGSGAVTLQAPGFAASRVDWSLREGEVKRMAIVLVPASQHDQVTVTASRIVRRIEDTPASVLVLPEEELAATAALTLDDALRQVPGFSLFRRSGSRTANPTSQGVSLRGLGANGASRAVVLEDGIPLNDPFGGWIYWGRIPRASVTSIEVMQGGASDLYGTYALGGAVQILTRAPGISDLRIEASGGSEATPQLSLYGAYRRGDWAGVIAGDLFQTDGYVPVSESERGRVDTPANSKHAVLDLTGERYISDRGRLFVKGSLFVESRDNGTPLQTNDTTLPQFVLGGDWQSRSSGAFSVRAYESDQIFHQAFSAIAAGRNSEALTRLQTVPAHQMGMTAQWSRAAGPHQTLLAGFEGQDVRGESKELIFANGAATSSADAGGRQRSLAVFGEDVFNLRSRWIVTAGARVESWRNFDAFSTSRALLPNSVPAVTNFADRTETAFSPRVSLLYRLNGVIRLNAAVYRSFRAPTLNELYRSFRLGNVFTLANDKLLSERLTGGEAGASLTAWHKKLTARGTFFWSVISRPVANVTLGTTPSLITRERENLGQTQSRGLELFAEAHPWDRVVFSGGYQFTDAIVLDFPANRALQGLQIPQVPRHQFTFQARYSKPSRWSAGVQARFGGVQFDDDQNTLPLNRYFVLDAFAAYSVTPRLEMFAAAENLFNQRYAIARTPVNMLGPPVLINVGLRMHLRQ